MTGLSLQTRSSLDQRREGFKEYSRFYDSVRGAIKDFNLLTAYDQDTVVISFDDNGICVGWNIVITDYFDRLKMVMWHGAGKAGSKNTFNVDDVGYATAAAAGLTGGGITPTGASVGTKQGFSIIKYWTRICCDDKSRTVQCSSVYFGQDIR